MMAKPVITDERSRDCHLLKPMMGVFWIIFWGCFVPGCGATNFSEAANVDDKISAAEFDSFISIIDSLSEKKLPELPETLLPRPHWTQERTLPIQDLVRQEKDAIDERWSIEWMTSKMPKSQSLLRALRREEMTPEQFVGLTLAIGAALTADAVDKRINLEQLATEAEQYVAEIAADETAFHSLNDEKAHQVLVKASWISIEKRVATLMQVPPENITLVRKNRERLDEIFPEDLKQDPLAELTNLMQERGIPFDEMPESGSDEHLEWDRNKAVIGRLP